MADNKFNTVSVTYMNGGRIPQDVIKEILKSCDNERDGISVAKNYITDEDIPEGTTQINVVIWNK